MNYMKRFAGLVCAVAAIVFFASCSKDKESGSLSFNSPAVFLSAGQTATVGFKSVNLQNLSVTNKPTGWADPTIDAAAQTLTITAPASFDDDEVKTGSLVLAGTPKGGSSVSATLFVGVVESEDLSGKPANSYVVSKPEHNYLFDAMHKGDGTSSLATASVDVVWQSKSGLIQYTELRDGKVSFYVGADSDDEEKIKEGNAVIGAYDAGGTMIWSWHIWAVNYNPETSKVLFNGYNMMDRNLGALANDNSTTDKILVSYGLYYQWGRKDPFIGPASYNAANGASASMYNGGGSRVYLKTEVSSAEAGTMDYAVRNPLTFIVGVAGSEYDWLWSAHSDALWSQTQKSVNDPCPYGWRVAPAAAFDQLFIDDIPSAEYADKFGWTLMPSTVTGASLFIGAGRRIYRHTQENDTKGGGSIQNFYPTPIPDTQVRSSALYNQPWVGYYWTAAASGTQSSAFYFWFDKSDPENSGVTHNTPQYRANGMQVRCVKAN